MSKKIFFQRDSFIYEIYKKAKKNKNIFFLSADFGAPALDIFRKELPKQFIHTGISEQNMIDVAMGMSLKRKIVVTYAMAPFILSRAWEQHKINSIMKLPMINLVPGVGYGYANAGPTHYSNEDLGLANLIVGSNIYTTSDAKISKLLATDLIKKKQISFVRLDRSPCENINHDTSKNDIKNGYRTLIKGKELCIISHGHILNKIYQIASLNEKIKKKINLIDLFKCKPLNKKLLKIIKNYKSVIVFDEQYENFNLSDIILKNSNKFGYKINLKSYYLNETIDYGNDGREKILERNNLSSKKIEKTILKFL